MYKTPSPPAGPGGCLDPHRGQWGHLDAPGLCAAQPGVGSEVPGVSPRSRWQSWSRPTPSGSRSWRPGTSDSRLQRRSACTEPDHRLHRPRRPERGSSGRRRCWRGRWAGRGAQGRGAVPTWPQPELLQATPGPPLCPPVTPHSLRGGGRSPPSPRHHRPPSRGVGTVPQSEVAGCEVSRRAWHTAPWWL